MTLDLWRIVLFVINGLIVVCVTAGFIYLKKYLDTHKKDAVKDNEKKLRSIITTIGVLIAALGFVAIAVGVGSRFFNN